MFAKQIKSPILSLKFKDLDLSFQIPISDLIFLQPAGNRILDHPGDVAEFAQSLHDSGKLNLPQDHSNAAALLVAIYLYCSLVPSEARSLGLDITVRSSIPIGAGLGSSAAYSSALASIILTIASYPSADLPSLQLVNEWAFKAEQVVHGTPSGVDNSTVVNGGFVKYVKGESFERLSNSANPVPAGISRDKDSHKTNSDDLMFIVVDSKVPKNTKAMVASVSRKVANNDESVIQLIDEIGEISNELFQILNDKSNQSSKNSKISVRFFAL
ncbi:Mevalonate kinase [Smittium mucronatum]|uniref:mevalonate kinase n=1 Tax=Smittium mucronatum TaxID=133383 RepID=A0A1R0H1B4_9FUNG|nr:Mevalonate kinase [Smittium mucronatum]